jgi:hypothetical protein
VTNVPPPPRRRLVKKPVEDIVVKVEDTGNKVEDTGSKVEEDVKKSPIVKFKYDDTDDEAELPELSTKDKEECDELYGDIYA